jgi:hypothetical protein
MPARGSSTLQWTVSPYELRALNYCCPLLVVHPGVGRRSRATAPFASRLLAARGKHRPSVNRRARSRGRRPAGGALGAGLLVAGAVCSFSSGGSRPSWAPSGPWMPPRMVPNHPAPPPTPLLPLWPGRDQSERPRYAGRPTAPGINPHARWAGPAVAASRENRAYHYIWRLSWDPGLLLDPSAPLLENLPLAAPSSLRQWLCELRPPRPPT